MSNIVSETSGGDCTDRGGLDHVVPEQLQQFVVTLKVKELLDHFGESHLELVDERVTEKNVDVFL